MHKSQIVGALGLAALLTLSSCSVYLEAGRPEYKDVSLIHNGMARSVLIQDLGPANDSYKDAQGRLVDVFKLDPEGQKPAIKVGIIVFHVAADVLTLGLWELVGAPVEEATQHERSTYVVTYQDESVALVEFGSEAIQPAVYGNAVEASVANQFKALNRE